MEKIREKIKKDNSDLNRYRITTSSSSSSSKNCVAFLQFYFFGLLLAETQLASRLQFLQFLQ